MQRVAVTNLQGHYGISQLSNCKKIMLAIDSPIFTYKPEFYNGHKRVFFTLFIYFDVRVAEKVSSNFLFKCVLKLYLFAVK